MQRHKHLALRLGIRVSISTLTALAYGACTWGWADSNCTSNGCAGTCARGFAPIQTKYYCQMQGQRCCECKEEIYQCVGSGCLPHYYQRSRT